MFELVGSCDMLGSSVQMIRVVAKMLESSLYLPSSKPLEFLPELSPGESMKHSLRIGRRNSGTKDRETAGSLSNVSTLV